jgi:hypothetical protein
MIIIFHFVFKMLKNPILKVDVSRIFLMHLLTRCPISQNGIHVNEILIFFKFQIHGALKNTYVLSNYASYNQLYHIFNMK